MGTDSNDKLPSYVLKQLKQFNDVGRVVYNRPKSVAAPETRYLESTILQLIASGILGMEVNEDDGKARLVITFRSDDSMPCYMIDEYWSMVDTVEDDNEVNN